MKATAVQLLVCAGIALSTWLLYAPSLDQPFLPFDDDIYVTHNPHLGDPLSLESLAWTLRPFESNWIPLTWLSFELDHVLDGFAPRTFHRTNVLLHCASAALLYLALCSLTGARARSALAALIFALHPLHVESVVWVSERKDVLSGLFAILTLWSYAHYTRAARSGAALGPYLLVLLCFALGLAAKPMLVTLPLVLLLLDYWPLRRLGSAAPDGGDPRRTLVEKIPFLLLSLGDGLLTMKAQKSAGAVANLELLGLGSRVANALISYLQYVFDSLWPRDLAIFYPHPKEEVSLGLAALALVLLLLATGLVWRSRRERPYLLVGWLWFVVMLLPVIGILQVGLQARADRYMYLPQIGLSIALLWSLPALHGLGRAALVSGCAMALGLLAWATHTQLGHWSSASSIFEHTLAVTEPSAKMHHTLGLALLAEERDTEALEHFRLATGHSPEWTHPYIAIAEVEARVGDLATAERAYAHALRIEPDSISVRLSTARLLIDDERPEQALPHLLHALGADDGTYRAEIQSHLGLAYSEIGDYGQAMSHLGISLAHDPDNARVHSSVAMVLQKSGELESALASYRRAAALDPTLAGVHGNIGLILHQLGREDEAMAALQRAETLGERDATLDHAIYEIHLAQGDRRKAIEALRAAHRKEPDGMRAANDLAWHLATEADPALRNPEEARELARQVVKRTGRANPAALDTLAAAWAALGDWENALRVSNEAFEKARNSGDFALATEIADHRREIQAGRVPH